MVLAVDADDLLLQVDEILEQDDPDPEELARGADLARRGARLARKAGDRALEAELALAEATALNRLGECGAALARLEELLTLAPEHPDAGLERGFALYELCRFGEARTALDAALRRAPDDPWGHHLLGLVLERQGERKEAERRFARARRLAPHDYPPPPTLSAAAFDAAVEAALERLSPQVRRFLSNVPVTVEELPGAEDLLAADPPLSPSILGLFRGAPHGRKGSDLWSDFPSSIVLYQRNLERFARDREELVEQIGVTLVHEVGHFLGLDEDELWGRGLD